MEQQQISAVNDGVKLSPYPSSHKQLVREVGKADRLQLTDAIQEFVDYTDLEGCGSTNPGLAYVNITRQIYAPLKLNLKQKEARAQGVDSRDTFTAVELAFVQTAEISAAMVIRTGIRNKDTRQKIKADIKNTVGRISHAFTIVPKEADNV